MTTNPLHQAADTTRLPRQTFPFVLAAGLYDTPLVEFEFDQPRVVIGRAEDVDLKLAHLHVSRRQLTVERILPPVGAPRFRIVPHGPTKNPVLLNGTPAVEGTLRFGDVLAIGELRLVLRRAAGRATAGRRVTPLRLAIGVLALFAVAALTVGLLPTAARPTAAIGTDKLFANLPSVSCPSPEACTERARTSYAHGRTYAKEGASVPGNWYRATIEFYRAGEFARLAGRTPPELTDVRDQLERAANAAETIFNDLQFRLSRDLKADNAEAIHQTVDLLSAALPDEQHPVRVKLAEYLRDHPLPKKATIK